jgi:methionine-rich copper-binding protein CopC
MMRKAILRAVTVSLLGFIVSLGLFASTGFAHADLESSNPAADASIEQAPAQIEVVFSAEVGDGTLIEVFGPDGGPVHAGVAVLDLNDPDRQRATVALRPNLPAGVYTVNWTSASTDGHTESGSFTFTVTVGAGGATASPIASPVASPAAVAMTENEVKEELHVIADQAQQQATIEAASDDPIDDGDFFLSVLAGVGAAILIYFFWRKVRPSAAERVL